MKRNYIPRISLATWVYSILIVSMLLFSAYFSYMAFLRHDNFHSLRLDLGNMDQTVWNVLHGYGFTLTDPVGTIQESRLAVHADFLLILLAPFYLIWSDPRMLLIIQSVTLALGALPLFWLGRKVLKDSRLALLFASAYLLYPTIQLNALHDFHATSLTTTFFLFAFWYFVEERPFAFLFFAILAALGKEQFWSVTALMGIAWIFRPKYRWFGGIVAALSFTAFYLLFWKFIPAVTPTKQHWAIVYLSEYGGSLNQILKNILIHPLEAMRSVIAPDRLYYYFELLVPVGFVSLISPAALIFAAPSMAINVLTNDPAMRMIDYQYTAGITPWVFISAIYGFALIQKKLRRSVIPVIILLFCIIGSVWYWGELPFGVRSRFWYFHWEPIEAPAIRRVEHLVPSRASVSVTNNIGAHFAEREFLYNFPMNADKADYDLVLLGDQYAWPSGDIQRQVLQSLLTNSKYELIAHTGSFYALKRISL